MRKTFTLFVLVLALVIWTFPVQAQEEEGFSFDIWGFVNAQNFNGNTVNEGVNLGWTRIYPTFNFSPRFKFELELEGAHLDDNRKVEWLHQARLVIKLGDNTTIQLGRNFRGGAYNTADPAKVRTAKYPGGYPYDGWYAYGVRFDHERDKWMFRGDLVTTPGGFRDFDLSRPEISFHAQRKVGENHYYGFSTQVSKKFARGGVNFGSQLGRFNFFGGVYANTDQERTFSGLLFGEYELFGVLYPHSQIAFEADGKTTWTNGLAVVKEIKGREAKFIADYDGDFLFRTQLRF